MNASSEHVPQSAIWGYGEVDVGETKCYILMTAPVGVGNITVGYSRAPNSNTPTGDDSPPPGLFPDSYVLPVHFEVKDPVNQTIVEEDLVTPGSFEVNFKARGKYTVYITSHGNETSPMPIGVRFEEGNPENREADKYLLSIILTASGATLIVIGLVMRVISNRVNNKNSKSSEKELRS